MKCADQTRIANGYKSHPMLAPIVGQCFLPTHTWRKSNCTNDLNTATFDCQVRDTTVLALPRRTPSYREVTNGYRCRPRSIPRRTRRSRFSWASFVALFTVRSADQLWRWRHSSADTFSRLNIHALIIDNVDGEVLALEHNQIHAHQSPVEHAEQRALRMAIARIEIKRPRAAVTTVEAYYREQMSYHLHVARTLPDVRDDHPGMPRQTDGILVARHDIWRRVGQREEPVL